MHHHVTGKQPNSKLCFVCGLKNQFGLKAAFYELDNSELVAVFTPKEEHQSYPNRLHGGMAAAMLDETIGRAIMMQYEEEIWGVTLEFSSTFRKPVPLDQTLRIVGRITRDKGRIFEGTGELLLEDGTVAVEGRGRYLKMPLSKITYFDAEEQEWRVNLSETDPTTIKLQTDRKRM